MPEGGGEGGGSASGVGDRSRVGRVGGILRCVVSVSGVTWGIALCSDVEREVWKGGKEEDVEKEEEEEEKQHYE
ncbi:hypothetical protein E2C01_016243 [Portunus trituberculatus]|uniref:Uncharacterized protein n=1 Tax=Portunus trituberculatus TaxID=210409 RepID=A0A5B7DQ96_PORTR|nr:hypothetical protein [Portunus trituberculatus]